MVAYRRYYNLNHPISHRLAGNVISLQRSSLLTCRCPYWWRQPGCCGSAWSWKNYRFSRFRFTSCSKDAPGECISRSYDIILAHPRLLPFRNIEGKDLPKNRRRYHPESLPPNPKAFTQINRYQSPRRKSYPSLRWVG